MSMKESPHGVAPSTPPDHGTGMVLDKEEAVGRAPDEKKMTEGTREQDFMTRNGLNMRSFQKRKNPSPEKFAGCGDVY